MKIYQRFLYVGLGGTGLKIGSQLEQALRMELCGADGQALIGHPAFDQTLAPFQLPSFAQFVYADFDERERLATRSASERMTRLGDAHTSATFISNLTPHLNSYASVAESLRTAAFPVVNPWLPAPENEPQVAPLQDGAGQFPTVGRAALFETIRSQGLETVMGPLQLAISRLANAGGGLAGYAGGAPAQGCDVFVGFSVAGGTGAGLFYDFLRIIAWEVGQVFGQGVHIYPLVVVPSAFPSGKGGGRAATLNGGPALRELFRLVDQCNTGTIAPTAVYPDDGAVSVPGADWVASGARTAFLFTRPNAISLADLHRSIVAFALSLVGAELQAQPGNQDASFASWFVNRSDARATPAPDGIGRHPASTALAAQLTIPTDEIADILSSRLVAEATAELRRPRPSEQNREHIERFIAAVGLTPLRERAYQDALPEPLASARGAAEVFEALMRRRQDAEDYVNRFSRKVDADVAQLAERLNPPEGVRALASRHDLFRVARVVLGDQRLGEAAVNREGVVGFMQRRGEPLDPNEPDFKKSAPKVPALTDRRLRRVKMSDAVPAAITGALDEWYEWRTQAEWHQAWSKHREYWLPKMTALRRQLSDITRAFEAHLAGETARFQESCHRLYGNEQRVVVYFLPEGGQTGDLSQFYESALLPALRERLELPEGADSGQILNRLIGDRWLEAYLVGARNAAQDTVGYVLEAVGNEILSVLTSDANTGQPLLPRLSALLAAAANDSDDTYLPPALLGRFTTSLGSLLPAGFGPQGTGPLAVHVFYPAAGVDAQIEAYLRRHLGPHGANAQFFRIADANFVSVVLSRVARSATDVPDYRALLRTWAEAIDQPRLADYLPWRQRLGYDARWVALAEDDRVEVLLRILNAMWDGSISVLRGTPESPEAIAIHQYASPDAPAVELELRAYGTLSRWSNVLRAYERYALGANATTTARCEQLISRLAPMGTTDDPAPPSDLYRTFRGLVHQQQAEAQAVHKRVAEAAKPAARQALDFWCETVPRVFAHEFYGGGGPRGRNHDELFGSFKP